MCRIAAPFRRHRAINPRLSPGYKVKNSSPAPSFCTIALAGKSVPSLISLRLSSSRVEYVNTVLQKVLPGLEQDVLAGMMIAVEVQRIRRRPLPVF